MANQMPSRYEEAVAAAGYVMAVPRPSPDQLEEHYRDQYFQKPSGSYQTGYSSEELQFFRVSALLTDHCVANLQMTVQKTLLDLGCGEGFFAANMSDLGWGVRCVDYSIEGVSRFNPRLTSSFTQASIDDALEQLVDSEQTFGIINLSNVLEHVLDPEKTLERLRKKLRQQNHGVLRLVIPNDYSAFQTLLLSLGLARKTWFVPPEHLNYFNLRTISALLEESGFDILDALSDFPIEWFLANSTSNYHVDPTKGKAAHNARVLITNFLAAQGIPQYANFCRAAAQLDTGRDLIIYAIPNPSA